MNGNASKTLIGAFVVGAVVLIVTGLLIFGGGKFIQHKKEFVLFFEGSVKGLSVGAPVLFGGVQIGTVKNISIEADAETLGIDVPVIIEVLPNKIRLIKGKILPIEKTLPLLIKRGLRAQLSMGSFITGQLIIELDYHPDTPVHMVGLDKKYHEIPTIPSTFQRIYDTLKDLPLAETLEKFTSAVSAFEKILKSPEIPEILHSLNMTLKDSRELINHVDDKIDPLTNSMADTLQEYRNVAVNVNAEIKPLADGAKDTLNDAQKMMGNLDTKIQVMGEKIGQALKASHEAMKQAEETLKAIEKRVGKDSPLLNQLDNTLKEFSEMARSIRSLANYLSRHPEALIRGKSENYRR